MWNCEARNGLLVMKMSIIIIVLSGWSCDYLFRVGCEKHVYEALVDVYRV